MTLQMFSLFKEEDGSGQDVPNLLPVAPTWARGSGIHDYGAEATALGLSQMKAPARHSYHPQDRDEMGAPLGCTSPGIGGAGQLYLESGFG